jgi:hypothetical protein
VAAVSSGRSRTPPPLYQLKNYILVNEYFDFISICILDCIHFVKTITVNCNYNVPTNSSFHIFQGFILDRFDCVHIIKILVAFIMLFYKCKFPRIQCSGLDRLYCARSELQF